MRLAALTLSLGLVFAGSTVALAEQTLRMISVSGQGEVAAEPDMATVRIGVTYESAEASEAMAQTSQGASKVLARLQEAGIAPRDLQTGSISLNPVWSNNRQTDEPARITGFVASISVTARVRALETLGFVLDAVVSDGANHLGGIQFGFQNPDPLMDEARRRAVADGQAKARLLADAAGVALGPLQSMSEFGGAPRPESFALASRAADMPIATGELSLSANVSMVYAIGE
ncbi:MAG: SIMPL domain-containing protein [Aestuariivita sp.]|uniref:SIMPL domain-containing protein n=1 Tax=Aestuariivita sp. TaxID=1872407 RepID=UPI003BAF0D2C